MATSTCPACGANAFVTLAEGGSCSRCGYASGESNRCPHCNAVARIDGSGVQSVCAMCGGPRIPGGFGGDAASNALREQKKALANARLASVATVVQGIFASAVTLVALAVMPASIVGKVVLLVLAIAPLVLSVRSRARAAKAREHARAASERAWQAAAEAAAAHSKGGITPVALAKMLAIPPEHADELLAALTVQDRTRIDVGDDAEVRYSAGPNPLVRIGPEPSDTEGTEEELADEAKPGQEGRVR